VASSGDPFGRYPLAAVEIHRKWAGAVHLAQPRLVKVDQTASLHAAAVGSIGCGRGCREPHPGARKKNSRMQVRWRL